MRAQAHVIKRLGLFSFGAMLIVNLCAIDAASADTEGLGGPQVTAASESVSLAQTGGSLPDPEDTYTANADGSVTSAEGTTSDSSEASTAAIDKTPITEAACKAQPRSSQIPDGYFRSRWAHCNFYTQINSVQLTYPDGTVTTTPCWKADLVESHTGLGSNTSQQFRFQLYVDSWRKAAEYITQCSQVTWNTGFFLGNALQSSQINYANLANISFDFQGAPTSNAANGSTVTEHLLTQIKEASSNLYETTPGRLDYRCDSFYQIPNRGFTPGQACIFPKPLPTLQYSQTQFPNVTKNIQTAIDNGSPTILNRIFIDTTAYTQNGNAKDRRCANLDPKPNSQCDEYPFASSYQGLRMGGGNVLRVPGNENGSAGNALRRFYADDRVIGAGNGNISGGNRFKVKLVT